MQTVGSKIDRLERAIEKLMQNFVQLDMYLYLLESVLISKGIATKQEIDELAKKVKGPVDKPTEPPKVA